MQSDWFGSKRTFVWIQINRKMVNTIWFRVHSIRFEKYFSVCTYKYSYINIQNKLNASTGPRQYRNPLKAHSFIRQQATALSINGKHSQTFTSWQTFYKRIKQKYNCRIKVCSTSQDKRKCGISRLNDGRHLINIYDKGKTVGYVCSTSQNKRKNI